MCMLLSCAYHVICTFFISLLIYYYYTLVRVLPCVPMLCPPTNQPLYNPNTTRWPHLLHPPHDVTSCRSLRIDLLTDWLIYFWVINLGVTSSVSEQILVIVLLGSHCEKVPSYPLLVLLFSLIAYPSFIYFPFYWPYVGNMCDWKNNSKKKFFINLENSVLG